MLNSSFFKIITYIPNYPYIKEVITGCQLQKFCGPYHPGKVVATTDFQFQYTKDEDPCGSGNLIFCEGVGMCNNQYQIVDVGIDLCADDIIADDDGCYVDCGCLFPVGSVVNSSGHVINHPIYVSARKKIGDCTDPPPDCSMNFRVNQELCILEWYCEEDPDEIIDLSEPGTDQCKLERPDGKYWLVEYCSFSGCESILVLDLDYSSEDPGFDDTPECTFSSSITFLEDGTVVCPEIPEECTHAFGEDEDLCITYVYCEEAPDIIIYETDYFHECWYEFEDGAAWRIGYCRRSCSQLEIYDENFDPSAPGNEDIPECMGIEILPGNILSCNQVLIGDAPPDNRITSGNSDQKGNKYSLEQHIIIYPNPFTNKLTVQFPDKASYQSGEILLTDVFGKIITTEAVKLVGSDNTHEMTIDTSLPSGLPSGIYLLIISDGKGNRQSFKVAHINSSTPGKQ